MNPVRSTYSIPGRSAYRFSSREVQGPYSLHMYLTAHTTEYIHVHVRCDVGIVDVNPSTTLPLPPQYPVHFSIEVDADSMGGSPLVGRTKGRRA